LSSEVVIPSGQATGPESPPDGSLAVPSEPSQRPPAKSMVLPGHPKGKQLAALIQAGVRLELLLDPFRAWAIQEPGKSAKWVETCLDGDLKARLLADAVAIWSEESPGEALGWLLSLGDASGLEGAFQAALHSSAKLDPRGTAVWLTEDRSHGSLENWQTVLTVWGETQPVEAARFFSTQIQPLLKASLLSSALIGMREVAAAEILLRDVDGPTADRAISTAAKALSFGSPQYALRLAERIADSQQRGEAYGEILSRWRETNPAEAFSYAADRRLDMPQPAILKAINPPAQPGAEVSPLR
jgi:hypothetical protein